MDADSVTSFAQSALGELLWTPQAIVAAVAWLWLIGWLVVRAPGHLKRAGRDGAALVLLAIAALVLRLDVPWGPLHFAEAERWLALWSSEPRLETVWSSSQVLALGLRGLGLHPGAVLRWLGPLSGALGVAGLYALARSAGAAPRVALVGALALLCWPLHVRYSASGGLTVPGATLLVWAGAATSARHIGGRERTSLVAALVVLGVLMRPEYRLMIVALAPLVLGATWSWRDRSLLGALLLVAFLPYLPALAPGAEASASVPLELALRRNADALLGLPAVQPVEWIVLGAAGLVVGRLSRPLRAACLLWIALLAVAYVRFGAEPNPLWGASRYHLSFAPALLIGLLGLLERVPAGRPRELTAMAAAACVLAGLVARGSVLSQPVDLQVEHAWIRANPPPSWGEGRMLAIGPRFRRLADMPAPDLSPRMSVATTLGAEPRPNGSPARIDDLVDNPAPADVLFLGLYRPDEVIAALSKRWRLVPIAEGRAMAAPATPHVNLGCAVLDPGRVDPSLAECEVTMGWYQLVSR